MSVAFIQAVPPPSAPTMSRTAVLLAAACLLLLPGALAGRELKTLSPLLTKVSLKRCPRLSCSSPFGWTSLKNCSWSMPEEICCGEREREREGERERERGREGARPAHAAALH